MKPGTFLTPDGEIKEVFLKTPFNHDTDAEAERTGLICNDPSKAQQHMKEEADINTIVRRFGLTGQLPNARLPPTLDQFAEDIDDFQTAMNMVAAAKQSFMAMSAEVRDAFHHDPNRFVVTVDAMLGEANPEKRESNLELLRAMGLAVPPGPKADTTTLGDLLAAIKSQGTPGGSPAPIPATGASKAPT